jgi:hypothetical protein
VIVAVSIKDDLHALAVQDRIRSTSDQPCHVVESDDLIDSSGFAWAGAEVHGLGRTLVPTRGGVPVDLRQARVVWWRRASFPQIGDDEAYSDQNAFISGEWRAALLGAFLTGFKGVWISDPDRTRAASNKLVQLKAAAELGWVTPKTLVSQDPAQIHAFCARAPGQRVVAKALTSTRGRTMATVPLTLADLEDADVTLCPAIYQHFIPGTRHLRINCFGEQIAAFAIETDVMDWRRDHAARMTTYPLDRRTSQLSVGLIGKLGLEMGVLDAKVLDSGDVCFLEVNPQGQFLFLEGATGFDLTGLCAAFLLQRARGVAAQQPSRAAST